MIFTAIGLLVVALVMLVAGIFRSSTALLTLSVLATLVASAVLYASFRYYRAKAAAEAGLTGASPPGWPAAYRHEGGGEPFVPPAGAAPAAAANGHGAPVPGWDHLPAADAARQVESLNLEELHTARRHEVEHEHRDDVLAAIDARIDRLVTLRRSVSPADS